MSFIKKVFKWYNIKMSKDSFSEYVLYDLFCGIPDITSRKMFSGLGFYKDGVFFAFVSGGQLYFKVGEINKYLFENLEESEQFSYTRQGKEIKLSFWSVPEKIFEDREKLFDFVYASVCYRI